jgi:hypothetical protein
MVDLFRPSRLEYHGDIMTKILEYTNGWLYLSDGSDSMEVWFQRCLVKFVIRPLKVVNEVAGINITIPGGKQYLEWNFQGILLTSHEDFSTFIDTIKDWATSANFTLGVKRDGSNYIEWDGDNSTYTVNMTRGLEGMEKKSPGTQDKAYVIGRIIFRQTS